MPDAECGPDMATRGGMAVQQRVRKEVPHCGDSVRVGHPPSAEFSKNTLKRN